MRGLKAAYLRMAPWLCLKPAWLTVIGIRLTSDPLTCLCCTSSFANSACTWAFTNQSLPPSLFKLSHLPVPLTTRTTRKEIDFANFHWTNLSFLSDPTLSLELFFRFSPVPEPVPEPVQLNQSGSRFKSVLPGESGASGSRNESEKVWKKIKEVELVVSSKSSLGRTEFSFTSIGYS